MPAPVVDAQGSRGGVRLLPTVPQLGALGKQRQVLYMSWRGLRFLLWSGEASVIAGAYLKAVLEIM